MRHLSIARPLLLFATSCNPNCPLTYTSAVPATPGVVSLFSAGQPQGSPVWLQTQQLFNASVTADLDGDGRADLIILEDSLTLGVWLSRGDGTFGPEQDSSVAGLQGVGGEIYALVVGDFNGDGRPDVVVVACSAARGLVLVGSGDGTLTAGPAFSLISAAAPDMNIPGSGSVVAGDFDGDGKLDLAFSTAGSAWQLALLAGNGDGTFAPATFRPVAQEGLLNVGDLDGDGSPDLILTDTVEGPQVLLNNGDGTFRAGASLSLGSDVPQWVALGDFNGDGRLDVVVAAVADNVDEIAIFLGAGGGAFGSALTSNLDGQGEAFALGDFDGNGKLELASDVYTGNRQQLEILRGLSNGTFAAAGSAVPITTNQSPTLIVGDFDGSGVPKVAAVTSGSPAQSASCGSSNDGPWT